MLIDIHSHGIHNDGALHIANRITGRDLLPDDAALCSCGIHPWYIQGNGEAQLLQLQEQLKRPNVVAIGECGLDRLALAPLPLQTELFRQQVALSESCQKPLIIHCVKAWDLLLALQKEIRSVQPWIVHGFRGNAYLARQLTDKGLWLSLGQRYNRQALSAAWPDRIFIETDESTTPLAAIYQSVADTLHIDLLDLIHQIELNCSKIFPSFSLYTL